MNAPKAALYLFFGSRVGAFGFVVQWYGSTHIVRHFAPDRRVCRYGWIRSLVQSMFGKKKTMRLTFIAIPADEFMMGIQDESRFRQSENIAPDWKTERVSVNLTRPLAVCVREVTWRMAEGRNPTLRPETCKAMGLQISLDEPLFGIRWFDAVDSAPDGDIAYTITAMASSTDEAYDGLAADVAVTNLDDEAPFRRLYQSWSRWSWSDRSADRTTRTMQLFSIARQP